MSAPSDGRMREEILHDSAATLRQVAEVLTDLGEDGTAVAESRVLHTVHEVGHSPHKLAELIRTLLRAYAQLLTVAETLAKKRDVLENLARGHVDTPGRGRGGSDVGTTLGYVFTVLDELEDRIHQLIDAFHVPVLGFTHEAGSSAGSEGPSEATAASEAPPAAAAVASMGGAAALPGSDVPPSPAAASPAAVPDPSGYS